MVSNQLWVICPMFGKTGIRGQEYGKEITLRANLDHCVGSRFISICYGKSCYYKADRSIWNACYFS